jgi:hypothetical protein
MGYRILMENFLGKDHLEDQEEDGRVILRKLNCYNGMWMRLAWDRVQEILNFRVLLSENSL